MLFFSSSGARRVFFFLLWIILLIALQNIFSRSGTTGHKHSASTTAVLQPLQPPQPLERARPPPQGRNVSLPTHRIDEDEGQPPPPGGYYAPEKAQYGKPPLLTQAQFVRPSQPSQSSQSSQSSPPRPAADRAGFVGGHRLSDQLVGVNRRTAESNSGFVGPVRSTASPEFSASARRPESPPAVAPASHQPVTPPAHPAGAQYETPPIPAPYTGAAGTAVYLPQLISLSPGVDPSQFPQGIPVQYIYQIG
ncbi:hypothetical protein GP486_007307, partial [Trichoglossum hirsutum]